MPAQSLHDLADQYCSITGTRPPTLEPEADGSFAFHVDVDDVRFTVTHDPEEHPAAFYIHVGFGRVPESVECRVLRDLMHANHDARESRSPVFSRDPDTGEIILTYEYPLAEASGENLLAGMTSVAAMVLQWRNDFSLEDGESESLNFAQFA